MSSVTILIFLQLNITHTDNFMSHSHICLIKLNLFAYIELFSTGLQAFIRVTDDKYVG